MELRTARLLIREFVQADWQPVYAFRRDARYQRFYPETEASEEQAQAFVAQQIEQQSIQPRLSYQLAIVLPENGQLIGDVGIRMRSLLPHQEEANQADIGYELDPRYWGRGYATEAARAILEFGFTKLKLHRIWATCLADNTASARVLEKLGMRLEGRLRDNEYFKNRWWDALIYAILENEWREVAGKAESAAIASGKKRPARQLRFRHALPQDAARLTEIAFAAKRYWGYPERWITVWRMQLIIQEDYIRSHTVILAETDGRPAGFYALNISGEKADLDYLWVEPAYIGQGIGRALFEHACRTAAGLGTRRMEIIADPNAEGFYRRVGADRIGESVYELEGQVRRLPRMQIQLDEAHGR